MIEQTKTLASNLLSLTRAMLELAQSGRWDELDGMDKQRGVLVRELFSSPQMLEQADDELLATFRDAQVCADLLMVLVTHERDRLGDELRSLKSSRKAEAAYANNFAAEFA